MGYSILIVDDSATTRAMVKRTIRMAGLPVLEIQDASNGKAALEMLQSAPVNLILADLNMPEMDGFEMIRRLRASDTLKRIPIVVLSASPSAEAFARLEHVNGFLAKPFTPEAVRDVITKALEAA